MTDGGNLQEERQQPGAAGGSQGSSREHPGDACDTFVGVFPRDQDAREAGSRRGPGVARNRESPGAANSSGTCWRQPAAAGSNQELLCAISVPSYDLDAVTYRYRWYRNGVFVKELGETPIVDAVWTSEGETWVCEVRATDGIEHSPLAQAGTVIGPPVEEPEDGEAP